MNGLPDAACTPANTKAIAEFAEETDAEMLRGALRDPSDSVGWQPGDIDWSEHLAKIRASSTDRADLAYCALVYSRKMIWPSKF